MRKSIKVGSQFSGVGAFEQALQRLNIEHENIYAADWDKFARQTYLLNYGSPEYYVKDVYDTPMEEITEKHGSLDLTMFSPPCQAFSLAGNRKGESDKRGVLFYNSHEFIQKNKPRFFIFENVKGLLSDDTGKTFQRWIDMLGGKTVNGNPVIFPHEDSTPYHVYYQVLNAKHYGIPQNRERIFIIGIRDDQDNDFSFPKPFPLVKRLKDVLESEVDEKYFLSDKMLSHLQKHPRSQDFISEQTKNVNCITSNYAKQSSDLQYLRVVAFGRSEEEKKRRKETFAKTGKDSGSFKDKNLILKDQDYYDTLLASPNPKKEGLILTANNYKGYDIATEEDSINFSNPNSETRRGRVGRKVAQTLDTACNQGVIVRQMLSPDVYQINPSTESGGKQPFQQNRVYDSRGVMTTLDTDSGRKSIFEKQRIRRLTPLECFRLMDFNKSFKWDVSDSQAYKQAGNSICVGVLAAIIERLKL